MLLRDATTLLLHFSLILPVQIDRVFFTTIVRQVDIVNNFICVSYYQATFFQTGICPGLQPLLDPSMLAPCLQTSCTSPSYPQVVFHPHSFCHLNAILTKAHVYCLGRDGFTRLPTQTTT